MLTMERPADADIGAPEAVRRTAEQLLPMLYDDVRRMARRVRRRESAGETLQTTALIHEAYLKLRSTEGFDDPTHFMRAAALAMRHVIVSYVRERLASKRGGGVTLVELDEASDVPEADPESDQALLDVNEALIRLAQVSERLAQVVECRFFAGYDELDTARVLGLTDRTVRRDWVKARAWLRRELGRDAV